MKPLRKNRNRSVFILFAFACLFLFSLSRVVPAEETKLPTIEELTDGKIKVGDLVSRENVELVKEYLSVGVYEAVKRGMVLEIGKSIAPYEIVPSFFREATEKNLKTYGEPVVNEGAVVYTQDGKPWPGGLPFPDPQNALEAIGNYKYGHGLDDFCDEGGGLFSYVDRKGKEYKNSLATATQRFTTGRLVTPPLGACRGMENMVFRDAVTMIAPLEIKGVGQLTMRYWDEVKNPDKGFAYVPAFKRVVRMSATTYQDNMAGSDITWGDLTVLREPAAYWNFKLVSKKVMLVSAPYGERPVVSGGKIVDPKCEYTEGKSFAKHEWALEPVLVIEGTPKVRHIYGKRVLYLSTPEYWPSFSAMKMADIYDSQMQLWKAMNQRRFTDEIQGESMLMSADQQMYDLQTGHKTHAMSPIYPNCGGNPAELTLKFLIQWGR